MLPNKTEASKTMELDIETFAEDTEDTDITTDIRWPPEDQGCCCCSKPGLDEWDRKPIPLGSEETFSEVDNSGVDADYFTAEADTGGIDGIDGFG